MIPQIVMSQTSVQLSGYVFESENGAPLPGVNIVVDGTNKGTSTDSKGYFQLKNLIQGRYTLTISMMGYTTQKEKITLTDNKKQNFHLQEKVIELDAVSITAKAEAREIREQAMPISVISMKNLQGTVSDITDVLAKTSGVQLRTSGGEGSATRISVRGLEGKRIGFFIDETPLNDNTDFLDINDIPVDMIDRIEVYKGIVPAKFGGSAVGGAVNIVIKEYPPFYVDAGYSVQSFNTHKASTVIKSNKDGYEFGFGGFYTYSDNNYEMELPLRPGTFVTRDHDRFEKIVIAGAFVSKNWWFDEVVFELPWLHTEKEIQGIEYPIKEAKSYADAYVLANHAEKENFLIEGLDLDFGNVLGYGIYRFEDKAMQKYDWDGRTYPPATIYGGEIGFHPNDVYNQKYTYMQKINLNYIINQNQAVNFNSQYNFARGIPSDTLKDKVVGHKTNFDSDMNSWVAGISHEFNTSDKKFTNALTGKFY
jgi:outer membrane receptor protein involved in Fe transport